MGGLSPSVARALGHKRMEIDPGEHPRSEIAGAGGEPQHLIYFIVLLRQTCYTFCHVTCFHRVAENHNAAASGGDDGVCM